MVEIVTGELLKILKNNFEYHGKATIENDLISIDSDIIYTGIDFKLPVKFYEVIGGFNSSNASLTTLDGAPHIVHGNFTTDQSKLTEVYIDIKFIDNLCKYKIICKPTLPLLKLISLKCDKIHIFDLIGEIFSFNIQVSNILTKYKNQYDQGKKKAILGCQKELIEIGYPGLASW